jgi:hypothetical protein
MIKILDLEEVGRKIFKANGLPAILDEILIDITSWYMYYSEQFIQLEEKEALFHKAKKHLDEKATIKDLESEWKISEEGQQHTRVKQSLKGIEKCMSNIKASIRRASEESHNQY